MFEFMPTAEDIERMRARHEMLAQDWRNRVRRFFDTLEPEEVVVLRDLFETARTEPSMAAYYEGVLAGLFITKFPDVCEGCGDPKAHNHGVEGEPRNPLDDDDEGLLSKDGQVNEDMVPENLPSPMENLEENLATYGVRLVGESPLGKVVCVNCKMEYQSLADRMLREPGPTGCGGCLHKTKFG